MSSKTITGSVLVENGAITTHRDSFLLSNLSVVSVRRPFLAISFFLGAGFCGFGIAFVNEHLKLTRVWHLKLAHPMGVYTG